MPGTIRLTRRPPAAGRRAYPGQRPGAVPVKGLTEPVEVFELVGASAIRRRLQASRGAGPHPLCGAAAGAGGAAAGTGAGGGGPVARSWPWWGRPAWASRAWSMSSSTPTTRRAGWCWKAPRCPTAKPHPTCRSLTYSSATAMWRSTTMHADHPGQDDRADPDARRDPPGDGPGAAVAARRPAGRQPVPATRSTAAPPAHPRRPQARAAARKSGAAAARWSSRICTGSTAETQALLDSLVESLPTARVLLLVNYRPEYQHGWGSKTYYTQLRLDPLPPASAEEFLQALLGDDPSLGPLTQLLIARTRGQSLLSGGERAHPGGDRGAGG